MATLDELDQRVTALERIVTAHSGELAQIILTQELHTLRLDRIEATLTDHTTRLGRLEQAVDEGFTKTSTLLEQILHRLPV